MARRASSSVSPALILGAIVVLGGVLAGGWFVYHTVSDPYRTLAPLDVSAYLDNANSLRGNTYKINATIANQLAWSQKSGRLYSVEVENRGDILPVLIPAQFNNMNIQKGQRYDLKIEVGDKGILKVQDVHKV
jgi:hypothetical protein